MKNSFKPQNDLETALVTREHGLLVKSIAEDESLLNLKAALFLEDPFFHTGTAMAVLMLTASPKQLKEILELPDLPERVKHLVTRALAPMPRKMNDGEKLLLDALKLRNSDEVIKLIGVDGIQFRNVSNTIIRSLASLTKEAAFNLLYSGLTPEAQAVMLAVLMQELYEPEILKEWSYEKRLCYANLMIHILSLEDVSPETPWYPEPQPKPYAYYLDPEHRYNPYLSE